jgi:outer membrane protein OmpA-like peptidoglycan-associated protein
MGNFVNSKYSDYSPVFNGKMNQVMFTSRRPRKPTQKYNKKFYMDDIFEDVYFAKYSNGVWHKVQLSAKKLPSTRHDATIFANKTLSSLYLYRSKRKLGDIYYTQLNNGKWSVPKPLLGEVNTQYKEASFFIAPDGKFAYFSSDRPGGKGGLDIYYIKKTGENTWTGAKLLNINSKYDEDAPYFDGEYLYFSSKRPESMGGYDIFRAKMISETQFEEPENIGFPYNSGGDDIYYYYHSDSNKVTLSSNRLGGFGLMDNYIVDLNQEIYTSPYADIGCDSLLSLLDELKDKLKNAQFSENNQENIAPTEGGTIVLTGNVLDNVTDNPIKNATVKLIDPNTNQLIAEQKTMGTSANYKFSISSGRNYRIIVEAPDYLKFSEDFIVPIKTQNDAHIKILPLQKSNSMKSIVLGWQFFQYNSAELSTERIDELDNLATIMKSNPEIKIKLIGHTDNDGSDQFNNNLSLKRAKAVAEYLIKKGIEAERIQTEGKGKREPLYDNNSRFKKWNRRVEVYIVN